MKYILFLIILSGCHANWDAIECGEIGQIKCPK